MVTKHSFKLVIYLLFSLNINSLLISEDKMSNIEIEIDNALDSYELQNLKIIDIRTTKEWQMTGVIPNSFLIKMHNEDYSENNNFTQEVEKILDKNKNIKFAFICASGARSEIAANYFKEKKYNNVFHIPRGILGTEKNGWLYLGYPIEEYREGIKEGN